MNRRGVTLIEMLVVVTILAIMAGVAFPAVTSGIDSLRLRGAADSVASFLNTAMNRANRRQDIVEVVIDPKANQLVLHSTEPGFERILAMPEGVTVEGEEPRHFFLMPNGAVPRVVVELVNAKGARKRVSVDPISGAPQIVNVDAQTT